MLESIMHDPFERLGANLIVGIGIMLVALFGYYIYTLFL